MKRNLLIMCGLFISIPVFANGFLNISPLKDEDFRNHVLEKVELGKNLFFDKILSGNKNISCATCHHPLTDTGDGLSLPVGEGGLGLGVTRDTGNGGHAIHERVPRNAPPIFNLGAHEFTVLFHDGRATVDPSQASGFMTPAGQDLPSNLDSILAAQAMFPVTSGTEMAGQAGENLIADAASAGDLAGENGVWALLAKRLQSIPEYVEMFITVFDDVEEASDISYVHAANAIAAFEDVAWRADNSPFDRFLRGDRQAMSIAARRGMDLFYRGKPTSQDKIMSCGTCHSGVFQTNHSFHAIAMPQVGPGKGDGPDGHDDFGRERVTQNSADRYKFRTPTLRNIALTAPYGHAGAYNTLRAVVEHHVDTVNALYNYEYSQAVLPYRSDLYAIDYIVMDDKQRLKDIANASEIQIMNYSNQDIELIIDFLSALTDPNSIDLRIDIPKKVPSGLPIAE